MLNIFYNLNDRKRCEGRTQTEGKQRELAC